MSDPKPPVPEFVEKLVRDYPCTRCIIGADNCNVLRFLAAVLREADAGYIGYRDTAKMLDLRRWAAAMEGEK